jgi:hypothetical protein
MELGFQGNTSCTVDLSQEGKAFVLEAGASSTCFVSIELVLGRNTSCKLQFQKER